MQSFYLGNKWISSLTISRFDLLQWHIYELIAKENIYSLRGTKVDIIYIHITGSIFISDAFPNVSMKILWFNMMIRTSGCSSQLPFHILSLGSNRNRNIKQQAEERIFFIMDLFILILSTINVLSVSIFQRNSMYNIICSSYYKYIIIN